MISNRWGNVTQLSFLPGMFPLNCFLVEEDDGLTLIDACMPFAANGILEAAKAAGKPLARIVLTHAHGDHIGAVPALKARFPEARIGISRREAALLRGDKSLLPGEPRTPPKGAIPKRAPFAPDFMFDDGDRLGSLTAVSAPGHTPGHFAFHESGHNVLIAGDAFQTRGGMAVSGRLQWRFPFPAIATWHAPTALESARKLTLLQPDVLAVGHGAALERPAAAMRKAIEQAAAAFERGQSR